MSQEVDKSLPVLDEKETKAGNYFVSNYPPFSFWKPEYVDEVERTLGAAPGSEAPPLGLYVHIPFCRKRCHFCYFKVYTDKNAREIADYTQAVAEELQRYAETPYLAGRKPQFVYFGGGTPSYLSAKQLEEFTRGLKAAMPWDEVREVTFECEPGTLNEKKLAAIREMGVTRLSLGIENFDDHILEINNRAHLSKQVDAAYTAARAVGFPQINIDLIAGMLEETEENWKRNIERTIEMAPDSVTIYQMEIPFNTTIYKQMKAEGKLSAPVADWKTKRRWVSEAFDALVAEGYTVSSAYTAVRDAGRTKFLYRDGLWEGADLVSVGVSSFGHLGGVHYQNEKDMVPYLSAMAGPELPIHRAYRLSDEERLIREFILQMKLGSIDKAYFQRKFGVDIHARFAEPLADLAERGLITITDGGLKLDRHALLQADAMLRAFFLPQHQTDRYV